MVVTRIPALVITYIIRIGVNIPHSTVANVRADNHRLEFAVLRDDQVTDIAVVGTTL